IRGFETASLSAVHDIVLSDSEYASRSSITGSENHYAGFLKVSGDLNLTADRIYPATRSTFAVISPGTISVLGNQQVTTSGPILSAGGSLSLEADRINHRGSLYAPLGTISLTTTERTFLAAGSILSTSGQADVKYGDIDDISWTVTDKKDLGDGILTEEVATAPEKSITIDGGAETIVMWDAVIDASGSGSIYSARFLPGVNGTEEPLTKTGRYVIVPGISLYGESGKAVYLEGGGLSAGMYSLVPLDRAYEYAKLPGSYVIEDLGTTTALGSATASSAGHPLARGSVVIPGTDVKSVTHTYAVRPAAEVLKEGGYQTREFIAGGGGSIDISGTTTILAGAVRGQALSEGYEGATLTLSGNTSEVRSSSRVISEDFSPEGIIAEDLRDRLIVSEESISNGGVSRINVGKIYDRDGKLLDETKITRKIDIEEGTTLSASTVTLNAADSITIRGGAVITAPGGSGKVAMKTLSGDAKETNGWSKEALMDGVIDIEQGAVVHAGAEVSIETQSLNNAGTVESEGDGRLSLKSERVVVAQDGSSAPLQNGLGISDRLTGFSGFSRLSIQATKETVFTGAASLGGTGFKELSIDAPRIIHDHEKGATGSVTLTAGTIALKNTSGSTVSETDREDTAGLAMNA
ncbi:hypothetical protein EG829_15625, partial [bacterium]|nr:hypothetical protein [bacterium]